MPARERLTWQDGDLFAPMDQKLPEGDLFMRIRQMFPNRPMAPMHLLALLALVGRNVIGRLGYRLPGAALHPPPPIGKDALLKTRYSPAVFDELVAAYLSTGAGIADMPQKSELASPELEPQIPRGAVSMSCRSCRSWRPAGRLSAGTDVTRPWKSRRNSLQECPQRA